MAEIRIEKKRRGLGWVWLFLALVIVALLAWYFLYPGRAATTPAPAPPTTGSLERTFERRDGVRASAERHQTDDYSGGVDVQEG